MSGVELARNVKGCGGKKCYDKKLARTVLNIRKREGSMVRMYQCPMCNMWHLTHLL